MKHGEGEKNNGEKWKKKHLKNRHKKTKDYLAQERK